MSGSFIVLGDLYTEYLSIFSSELILSANDLAVSTTFSRGTLLPIEDATFDICFKESFKYLELFNNSFFSDIIL